MSRLGTVASAVITRWLDVASGYVTTPDAPDLVINGDIRFTSRLRDDSAEAAVSRYIANKMQAVSRSWAFIATYGNSAQNMYAAQTHPTGAGASLTSVTVGSRTTFGLTPPGVDRYIGVSAIGVMPGSQAADLQLRGLTSPDGVTWSPAGTVPAKIRADALSFDDTSQLIIGSGWLGRIYWAQMEAINRRAFMFPGVAGNYLGVPDASNLDVAGDIEIVARLALPNWTIGTHTVVGKDTGSPPERAYLLRISAGVIVAATFVSGSTSTAASSSALPFTNGTMGWIKATRVAATGLWSFYSAADSPTEPTSWTSRGTITAATGSMIATTAPLQIGARAPGGSTDPLTGRIARVIVRDGIAGPKVLDVSENNASSVAQGATAFTSGDTGNRYTYFPGVAGNYLSAGDVAAFRITGDMTIVARIDGFTTTPYGGIATRWPSTNRAYMWRFTGGVMNFVWSPDGGTVQQASIAIPASVTNGSTPWIAMTFDADNGASGSTYRCFTSPDGTNWTKTGSDLVTAGVASIFAAAGTPLLIGDQGPGSAPLAGRVRRIIVRNGIAADFTPTGGTTVLDFNADLNLAGVDPAATSFALTTGGTATVNRSGSPSTELVTGRSAVTVAQTVPNQIIQALPDSLVWRFDANDYPGAGTSYVDPRGRTWTLSAPGAIVSV